MERVSPVVTVTATAPLKVVAPVPVVCTRLVAATVEEKVTFWPEVMSRSAKGVVEPTATVKPMFPVPAVNVRFFAPSMLFTKEMPLLVVSRATSAPSVTVPVNVWLPVVVLILDYLQ